MLERKVIRNEQEFLEQFSFEEDAKFSEKLTEEEFRQIVFNAYRKKKLLSGLEVKGANVVGSFYSKTNRELYDFTICFNHKGFVDGTFIIRLEYKEDVEDDWYVRDVANMISNQIERVLRNEPFMGRIKYVCRAK